MRLKTWHIYVFPQVQQNRLSVSKRRNYAQPTSECQGFFQGSVLQVTPQSQCQASSSLHLVPCPRFCITVCSRCRNVIHMFATAEGLLTQEDLLNSDGLQEVFATNLFGHFLLVHHTHKEASRQNKLFHHLKQNPNFPSRADLYCDPIPITRVSQF